MLLIFLITNLIIVNAFEVPNENSFISTNFDDGCLRKKLPPAQTRYHLNTEYFTQPLDHFNKQNTRTWRMRYYEYNGFYDGSGPIFVRLGGTTPINPSIVQSGIVYSLGEELNALMFSVEHRFYGTSRPTENLSVDNLKYLTTEQAIEDVIHFIETKKKEKHINKNSPVILFGLSYAGTLAVKLRLKYPNIILGALASSTPIYSKIDFHEYLDDVTNTLREHGKNCADNVKTAISEMLELIKTKKGAKFVKEKMRLCFRVNATNVYDIGTTTDIIIQKFSRAVQYNSYYGGTSSIEIFCSTIAHPHLGKTSFERLSYLMAFLEPNGCHINTYDYYLDIYKEIAWKPYESDNWRQWMYQTCTEHGHFHTSKIPTSSFGEYLTVDYFVKMCTKLFGEEYNLNKLEQGVQKSNSLYADKLHNVTNVIFVNGGVDPVRLLSVLKPLNDRMYAFNIKGISHGLDLQDDNVNDIKELKEVREKNRKIIKSWIAEAKTTH